MVLDHYDQPPGRNLVGLAHGDGSCQGWRAKIAWQSEADGNGRLLLTGCQTGSFLCDGRWRPGWATTVVRAGSRQKHGSERFADPAARSPRILLVSRWQEARVLYTG